ncbi:hypothetical protein ACFL54_05735 [Planctomycetota bacterium]
MRIHRFDPLPEEIVAGTVKLRCELSIAPLFGGPPTVIYEKEQSFPHAPRPLPEAVIPASLVDLKKDSENAQDKKPVGVAARIIAVVCAGLVLLWLLGWGAKQAE